MEAVYGPPDQEDQADKAFYRQLEATSHSQALVFMGDVNHCTSVGGTAQQGISNLRASRNALVITSSSKSVVVLLRWAAELHHICSLTPIPQRERGRKYDEKGSWLEIRPRRLPRAIWTQWREIREMYCLLLTS